MNKSRLPLLLITIALSLSGLILLVISLTPAPTPANALSASSPNLQTTPLPLDSDFLVVRAYYDDYQMVHDLSIWTEPWEVYSDLGFVVLGVTPSEYNLLLVLGFRVEVDEEATRMANQPFLTGETLNGAGYPTIPEPYTCYRTVEGTFMTAEDLVSSHPTLAAWLDAGDSWEKTTPGGGAGYDMNVLVLTNQNIPGPKPKLFITTSIHAREYTPAELATRFAEHLLSNYNSDPDVTWILDYHEIHLMLHANPDGRKMAETGLLWRKNTDNDFCTDTTSRGVDLNRNFLFEWGCCNGSSSNECTTTFRGPSPASEPETQAIQNYLRAIFPDQRDDALTAPAPPTATGIYLDIHSYGQLVIWPWGFTQTDAPNGIALQTLGRKFAYFNNYTPQQAIELYVTDGTTDDFAYGDLGLASYTFELGNTFFESCSYFEATILPENLSALLYAAKTVRTPFLTPAGPDAHSLSLSDAIVITGTPVQLTAIIDDTRYNNSFGSEPTHLIATAEYYIDVPHWVTSPAPVAHPMSAADGSFNAKSEIVSASVDTTGLAPGRHTIFVRGQDAAGNWGPVSAAFLWIEPFEQDLTQYDLHFPLIQR